MGRMSFACTGVDTFWPWPTSARRSCSAPPSSIVSSIASRTRASTSIPAGEVGDEIDRHLELADAVGEHHAGLEIALGVLHPVEEMRLRLDVQAVGQDGRAAMWRRAQPDDLRRHADEAVVMVGRPMGQRGVDAHGAMSVRQGARNRYPTGTARPARLTAPRGDARVDRQGPEAPPWGHQIPGGNLRWPRNLRW